MRSHRARGAAPPGIARASNLWYVKAGLSRRYHVMKTLLLMGGLILAAFGGRAAAGGRRVFLKAPPRSRLKIR